MMLLSMNFLVGCTLSRTGLVPGTGYQLVKPNRAAAGALVRLDRPAAERLASNERQCRRDRGCQK